MIRNILLTIEYDGTNFCGWQKQPNARTAQGVIEEALSIVCKQPISVDGTSRTDGRVHALGQRASFSGEFGIPTDRLAIAVNNILAGRSSEPGTNADIRIVKAEEVPEGFHARFSSKGKMYRYIIRNAKDMPVFLRNYRYHVDRELNLEVMQNAAKQIVGTHDFACFQAAGSNPRLTTVRTIHSLEIKRNAKDIILEISGDGFLYNMVRIITGTLIDVGLGKIDSNQVVNIIESKDRQLAGHTAPPQGLYLVEVYY